jgi:hypothetical protein
MAFMKLSLARGVIFAAAAAATMTMKMVGSGNKLNPCKITQARSGLPDGRNVNLKDINTSKQHKLSSRRI